MNQTYMKLNDRVLRPKFDPDKIDRKNREFVRVVDSYINWNQESRSTTNILTEYEADIISCLKEHDLDGYHLAEHLKNSVWLDPDAELVDILDSIDSIKRSVVNKMYKQWVLENFLVIPNEVLNTSVNYTHHKKGARGYIVSIYSETYSVLISETLTVKRGVLVNFEDVDSSRVES